MGAVRWLVIGMLASGCAHEDEDPRIGAVRASLGKAHATIADASALLEAESSDSPRRSQRPMPMQVATR